MHDGVDRFVVEDVAVVGDLLGLVLGAAVDFFGGFFAVAIEHVAHGGDFDLALVLQLDGRVEMGLGPAADADEAESQPLVGAGCGRGVGIEGRRGGHGRGGGRG